MPKVTRGFTMVENYFFDHVLPRVSPAEWKIISIILRHTVGWQCDDAEISYTRFEQLTGIARQAVVAAVQKACKRTVIQRRTQQVGKQRSFRYRAVSHANLKPVPKPDPRRFQAALPFATEFDNHTTSRSLIITPATEYENQTPISPGLRSIKKDRSINTHTPPAPVETTRPDTSKAAAPRVCGSKYSKAELKKYARAVGWIENPVGWANAALKTGDHDDDYEEWLEHCKRQEAITRQLAAEQQRRQEREHAAVVAEAAARKAAEQHFDQMSQDKRDPLLDLARTHLKNTHPTHRDWLSNPEVLRSVAVGLLLKHDAEAERLTA